LRSTPRRIGESQHGAVRRLESDDSLPIAAGDLDSVTDADRKAETPIKSAAVHSMDDVITASGRRNRERKGLCGRPFRSTVRLIHLRIDQIDLQARWKAKDLFELFRPEHPSGLVEQMLIPGIERLGIWRGEARPPLRSKAVDVGTQREQVAKQFRVIGAQDLTGPRLEIVGWHSRRPTLCGYHRGTPGHLDRATPAPEDLVPPRRVLQAIRAINKNARHIAAGVPDGERRNACATGAIEYLVSQLVTYTVDAVRENRASRRRHNLGIRVGLHETSGQRQISRLLP
jgi:hypothetical protein